MPSEHVRAAIFPVPPLLVKNQVMPPYRIEICPTNRHSRQQIIRKFYSDPPADQELEAGRRARPEGMVRSLLPHSRAR